MNFALAQVRTLRPEIGENNFMIGEFGFPRADFGECYAAESLREALEGMAAPDSFKVSYVFVWQIVDNGLIWDSDGWPLHSAAGTSAGRAEHAHRRRRR